jgi:hypothetical protein
LEAGAERGLKNRSASLSGPEGRSETVVPRFCFVRFWTKQHNEFVVSHNLHRRHLTTAQRAALALDLLPKLEEEARERQVEHGGTAPGRPAENDDALCRWIALAAATVERPTPTNAAAFSSLRPTLDEVFSSGGAAL